MARLVGVRTAYTPSSASSHSSSSDSSRSYNIRFSSARAATSLPLRARCSFAPRKHLGSTPLLLEQHGPSQGGVLGDPPLGGSPGAERGGHPGADPCMGRRREGGVGAVSAPPPTSRGGPPFVGEAADPASLDRPWGFRASVLPSGVPRGGRPPPSYGHAVPGGRGGPRGPPRRAAAAECAMDSRAAHPGVARRPARGGVAADGGAAAALRRRPPAPTLCCSGIGSGGVSPHHPPLPPSLGVVRST